MEEDHENEEDEDIYEEDGMEDLEYDDEISPTEEAFMKGYKEAEKRKEKEEEEE